MKALYCMPLLVIAIAGLVGLPATSQPAPLAQDGITARITGWGFGNVVFTPDVNDDYTVNVEIFQKINGVWQPAPAMNAALRVFTWGDHSASADVLVSQEEISAEASGSFTADWTDKVLIPFTSAAQGPVTLKFPRSAVNPDGAVNGFDLFVTFSELGGSPVPTSHHSVVKNQLISSGKYDEADALDYSGTHYALGA